MTRMTDKEILNIKRRYADMKQRCYNKNCKTYKHYGDKGILVCDEWLYDVNSFIKWSIENGYKKELSIDRIDNNGNYEPNNCRWTTKRIQNINKKPSIKSSTGYVGICVHSSSTKENVYYYGRVRDNNSKILYTGMSKDLKIAIEKRNEFILKNKLDNELNYMKGKI